MSITVHTVSHVYSRGKHKVQVQFTDNNQYIFKHRHREIYLSQILHISHIDNSYVVDDPF
jgi:hypothetical protein